MYESELEHTYDGPILFAFLTSTGYLGKKAITAFVARRLKTLHEFATQSTDEFTRDESLDRLYLSLPEKESLGIPVRWRGHHIFQPWIVEAMPSCFDFYMLAFLPGHERERYEILRFVSTRKFQRLCERREIHGSYVWDSTKRYCWSSALMPYFHGFFGFGDTAFAGNKLLLYMDLASRYPGASELGWLRDGVEHLEQFKLDSGRYRFPATYLPERRNSYFLCSGAHMGLGEKGRRRLEIESTFRALSLRARIGGEAN